MSRPKIGLALGGGGARGLAHIGVLKGLEKLDIPVDCIAGTSIGALVGAAYALRPDAQALEESVARFLQSPAFKESGLERFKRREPAENLFGQVAKYVRDRIVINIAHHRASIVGMPRWRRVIDELLDDATIEETRLPLVIISTDLLSGEDINFRKGKIRDAALASASIPGFLPPISVNGHLLVDGAVTSPVPVEAARQLGADVVIAVDVGQDLGTAGEEFSIVDIMFRTNSITALKLKSLALRNADLVIKPQVGAVHWAEFDRMAELVQHGYDALMLAQDELGQVLAKKRVPFWKKLFTLQKFYNDQKSG